MSNYFYTPLQVAEIKTAAGTNETATILSERLSKKFKRSQTSIYAMICKYRKGSKPIKETAVPEGTTIDMTGKRVVITNTYVKIYL